MLSLRSNEILCVGANSSHEGPMSRILSIQSHVSFGHVGNAAVTLPLQLLGHEVWPVPTAVLSNHAGYPESGGTVLAADTVHDILTGLQARGVDAQTDLTLTGYLGSCAVGEVVQGFLAQLQAINPSSVYCCDPVMGDRDTGLYVVKDLKNFFADALLPLSNILTPNHFELGVLAGRDLLDAPAADSIVASRELLTRMHTGGCVLITSFEGDKTSSAKVSMVAVTQEQAWIVETPRLAFTIAPHGAGDLASALFGAHFTKTGDPRASLKDMSARLHAVLEETSKDDSAELELVSACAAFMSPGNLFEVQALV